MIIGKEKRAYKVLDSLEVFFWWSNEPLMLYISWSFPRIEMNERVDQFYTTFFVLVV